MQYGYINENGCLSSREITDDQIDKATAAGWKPIREIDNDKLASGDDDHFVKVLPFDAGDCIDFHYERRFDRKKFLTEINRLKSELAGSDYKVTKCYEASMLGEAPPYDIAALRQERQTLRDRINELEIFLSQNA